MSATLQIGDDIVLVDRFLLDPSLGTPPPADPTQLVYLDIRSCKNPATKARNVRYRVAASAGWAVTFHLLWDKTVVSRAEMEAVLIDAGQLVGLGDGRTIGMGRFDLVRFDAKEATT